MKRRSCGSLAISLAAALALALLACADDDSPNEIEWVSSEGASPARAEQLRAKIPAQVAEICGRHDTDQSEHAEACLAAGRGMLEAVAQRLESSPAAWEKKILAIASICTREAFALAQSEAPGRSEQSLLVEGLERGPACVDRQFALLEGLARQVEQGS